jgi:hypothetical protein
MYRLNARFPERPGKIRLAWLAGSDGERSGKYRYYNGPLSLCRCESGAEPGTALGTTTGQDQAATLGCHAGTETVSARALDFAWLICAFHVAYLISNSKPSAGLARDENEQF